MLTVLGYEIVTSLFLPLRADDNAISKMVTYPYRAVMLLLALLLIVFTPVHIKTIKNSKAANTLFIFFIIYILRVLFDVFFRDVYVISVWRQTTIQYIFLSVLPSMWAIKRCAQYVDYDRLNKWLIWCSIVMIFVLAFTHTSLLQTGYNETYRMTANVAMDSIALGHVGCTLFFISLVWILSHKLKLVWKSFLIVMMCASFVIMLRAASRGPLIAFIIMLLMVLYSHVKNKGFAFVFSIIVVAIIWLYIDNILLFLGEISPAMEQRMSETVYEGNTSGRDSLYANAIDIFLRNPIFGEKFVLDIGFYSHNSLLDVLMALGLLGGLAWLYLMIKDLLVTSRFILSNSSLMIIGLLSMQNIIMHLFSGAIYISNKLIVLMAIVLLLQEPMATAKGTESYSANCR